MWRVEMGSGALSPPLGPPSVLAVATRPGPTSASPPGGGQGGDAEGQPEPQRSSSPLSAESPPAT